MLYISENHPVMSIMGLDLRNEDLPPEGIDTPQGRLYRPQSLGRQVLVLMAAFVGAPALGWVIGHIPGDLSETARTLVYVPYVLVFFIGYGIWKARLNAIAYEGIGRSLLKSLFTLFIRRRRPQFEEVLPSREKLLEMAVKAQKAGAAFRLVGWPLGMIFGLIAMLFESAMGALSLFALLGVSTVVWGYALAWLGRRGWLPFMEED